jgi:hypothetical protein
MFHVKYNYLVFFFVLFLYNKVCKLLNIIQSLYFPDFGFAVYLFIMFHVKHNYIFFCLGRVQFYFVLFVFFSVENSCEYRIRFSLLSLTFTDLKFCMVNLF